MPRSYWCDKSHRYNKCDESHRYNKYDESHRYNFEIPYNKIKKADLFSKK